MTTLTIHSYRANVLPGQSSLISIDMGMGSEPPFPDRVLEIKRTADAVAALAVYVADLKGAVTTPCAVAMRVGRRDRKPPGFDAATRANQGITYVNC